jgi:pimeloyl-ACP methyl ester carboxylesterase
VFPEGSRRAGSPLEVLLVPGLDGTGRLYAPLLDALPPSLAPRVIPYPPAAATLDDVEEHVASALPAGKPFAILAESFGGAAAIRVAARRPAGLEAVILAASFLRRPGPPVPSFLVAPFVSGFLLRSTLRAGLLRLALLGGARADLVNEALEAIRSVRPRILAARARAALRVDVREAFRSMGCPLLHIRGSRDRLIAPRRAAEMRALRSDLQEAILDAPHLVLQTRPAEAARILADFLRV